MALHQSNFKHTEQRSVCNKNHLRGAGEYREVAGGEVRIHSILSWFTVRLHPLSEEVACIVSE